MTDGLLSRGYGQNGVGQPGLFVRKHDPVNLPPMIDCLRIHLPATLFVTMAMTLSVAQGAAINSLGENMKRVGVFVDGSNIQMNGGFGMDYDVLRNLATRDGAMPLRMNTYIAYDARRAGDDVIYREKNLGYHQALRRTGFKVVIKTVKWHRDEDGNEQAKSNADLDMAVDMLLQTQRLDRVLLCTGDGDMTKVVIALQDRGIRVDVLGFNNVARELREAADQYIDGYMVPGLASTEQLPLSGNNIYVGIAYSYDPEREAGRISFMRDIPRHIWETEQWQQAHFFANRANDDVIDAIVERRQPRVVFNLDERPLEDGKPLPAAYNIQLF